MHTCLQQNQARVATAHGRGMTLIETLMVLVILGILMGMAAYTKPWAFEDRRIAEDARRLLQAAKSEAAKRNKSVWIEADGSSLKMFTGTAGSGCTVIVDEELDGMSSDDYHGALGFSSSYPGGLVRFNPQGFPRDCYGNPVSGEIDINGSGRKLCISVGGSIQVVRGGSCQ